MSDAEINFDEWHDDVVRHFVRKFGFSEQNAKAFVNNRTSELLNLKCDGFSVAKIANLLRVTPWPASPNLARKFIRIAMKKAEKPLFHADAAARLKACKQAKEFAKRAAECVKEKLPGKRRTFYLFAFREQGQEFLSFDWEDETGAEFFFNFGFGDTQYLPDPRQFSTCIEVIDATDALHLCGLIAKLVLGKEVPLCLNFLGEKPRYRRTPEKEDCCFCRPDVDNRTEAVDART